MNVPDSIVEICRRLNRYACETVIVGGAVRDELRGIPAHDYDLATSATPDEVAAIFGAQIRSNNGREHGTQLILTADGPVEITTFRADTQCDGRHAVVRYTRDLLTDLTRRDLTINAIAYNPLTQEYIDPFNGREDLNNRIIRFVGNGTSRILEDRLRAFRALRFCAMLNGRFADSTAEVLLAASRNGLLNPGTISIERVRDELLKTMVYGEIGLRLWDAYGLLDLYLPEVAALRGVQEYAFGPGNLLDHTLLTVDQASVAHDYPHMNNDLVNHLGMGSRTAMRVALTFTMLLHDIGKVATRERDFRNHDWVGSDLARAICRRLRIDKELTELVVTGVRRHMFMPTVQSTAAQVRHWAREVGEYLGFLLDIQLANRESVVERVNTMADIHYTETILTVTPVAALPVDGNDVMTAAGVSGPDVGRLLEQVAIFIDFYPNATHDEVMTILARRDGKVIR
jgi:tRNA nucleotidyltransferase (CCA-adding enzyme)